MRVARRLAFAVVFGIVAGALAHVVLCARCYCLTGEMYTVTGPDGSPQGFIDYTLYHDPYLGFGSLVIAFAIALWYGPEDWLGP